MISIKNGHYAAASTIAGRTLLASKGSGILDTFANGFHSFLKKDERNRII